MSAYPESPPRPVAQIATGVAPPHSLEAETSVLGGILLSDRAMASIRMEEGLVPEHFFRDRHRLIFEAMCSLHDEGHSIDVLTVTEQLRDRGRLDDAGGKAGIDELTGGVPQLGGIRRYGQIVIGHYIKREQLSSAYEQAAVILNHGDEDDYQAALQRAHVVVAHGATDGYLGPNALGSHMLDWLAQDPDDGLPMPLELAALRRMVLFVGGHLTLIAAHPGHGKSSLLLQLVGAFGRGGHRTVIWSAEDTPEQIAAKWVMSQTGVPASIITRRRVADIRMDLVVAELRRLPFEVVPCAGWTAQQVAAHIRQVRPEVACIDHFHALAGTTKTSDIDESVQVLAAAAAQTGSHIVCCAQLNRGRLNGVCKPPPVLSDLRGSAAFEMAAHTILLVHREEEEIDDPLRGLLGKARKTERAGIDVAKNKLGNGTGPVDVTFDDRTLRFLEPGHAAAAPGSPEAIGF